MEEAKKKQKQERMNSQAKFDVAKRGLILERDSMLRQQKLRALFSGQESTPAIDQDKFIEPTSVLA